MAVLDHLQVLAERILAREPNATLEPDALVSEAYIKLSGQSELAWSSLTHFKGIAGCAMKQVLVELARKRTAQKRRADDRRANVTLSGLAAPQRIDLDDVLALDEALERLSRRPPNGDRQARLITSVWFGGMTWKEAAEALGISDRQARYDWQFARTWLAREMERE